MKRRTFLSKAALASASTIYLPLIVPGCYNLDKPNRKITILHTNDMHSRIEPFKEGKYKGLGGMAARASTIQKIRETEPSVLLLDAGDVLQGTPYFNLYGGELEFKLMTQMGYDAGTIGNHEFDNGLEGLRYATQFADFPLVSSNYDFSGNSMGGLVEPFSIFRKNGMKVGVFGLGIKLEGLVNASMYGNTVYQDPVATAREIVRELQVQKVDLIICLSHLGYDYENPTLPCDKVLAEEVSGIDLILGGHTHTFMEAPLFLTNREGFTTTINQVGWGGINLGRIDVIFSDRDKKVAAFAPVSIQENSRFTDMRVFS